MPDEHTVLSWRLDPLPDFLLDHTLASEQPAERLREVVSRWVQFVGALWRWRNQATFALRYMCDSRRISVWLLGRAHKPQATEQLRDDVSVLLRAHALGEPHPGKRLDPRDPLSPFLMWPDAVLVEVRQFEHDTLWQIPERYTRASSDTRRKLTWVPEAEWKNCRVVFPWWAPGGPFLLPMEKLISQKTPVSLSVYLAPTELSGPEAEWLTFMARVAQSSSDQQEHAPDASVGQRRVDPAANLVGRLFMANYRRLSDKPFMVTVHCAAPAGMVQVARTLAGTMESIVYEPPFDRPQQEDDRLPSAATVRLPGSGIANGDIGAWRAQYETLAFTAPSATDPLWRMAYLVDARGAATAFRLPVNVRGGIPGLAVEQRPPDFHPGPREETAGEDEVVLGTLHQGGVAKVARNQFTKHALVTGFTGGGKTVTVLSLIHQLRAARVPVLAIESAKQEYRGLLGVPLFARCDEPLWVFTVGNEACAPIRLNPFELLPGVRVESHISRLQTCFEAALPPIGPLASMIGEALVNIYERAGWRLTDKAPEVGQPMYLRFPTMRDFFERMERLVEERGYEGEVRSNVTAAVLGRIKPLTIGSKGLIFRDAQPHIPGAPRVVSLTTELFQRSAVVELNDLNIEDKALLVMFLLTFLREYREAHKSADGSLMHITVVEEAHNVLENVKSTGGSEGGAADTRFKAVQAFASLLSEIRALGEGLIIADQSPEKLAPDAMRNTNIQIAHQLRDAMDREAIARAMIMDIEQRDFLGKLLPGQAALFVTGLQKATFIRVPKYFPTAEDLKSRPEEQPGEREARLSKFPGYGYRMCTDEEVRAHMMPVVGPYLSGPFDVACQWCQVRRTCDYRIEILRVLVQEHYQERFVSIIASYRQARTNDKNATIRSLAEVALSLARTARPEPSRDAVWCAFVHLWHGDSFNWGESFPTTSYQAFCDALDELEASPCAS